MTHKASRRTFVGVLVLVVVALFGWIVTRPLHKAPELFTAVSLSGAMEQAKAEHKLLLVDATAGWCPPCQKMERTTWVDDEVTAWVRSHAVAVQVDVDHDRADAQKLSIQAMPTVIVFKDGVEAGRSVGFMDKDQLLSWVGAVLVRGHHCSAGGASRP